MSPEKKVWRMIGTGANRYNPQDSQLPVDAAVPQKSGKQAVRHGVTNGVP
jgi:hypothetical protein